MVIIRIVICGLILVSLGGCAATGERLARNDWDVVHRARTLPPVISVPESTAAPGTLDELLEIGERNNPGLSAAFFRWTAALDRIPQARALPDPRFSYAYFLDPVETRVGPQRQKFGVSQTIPLFGKLGLRGEMAVQAANAAGARYMSARRDLRYRLSRLWNEYYFLGRSVAIAEEHFRLTEQFESVALSRYTTGQAPHSAVIRTQVELGRQEDRLQSLRKRRAPVLAALNAELNRAPTTPIPWPDSLRVPPLRESLEVLSTQVLETHPELLALRYLEEVETAAARLAGRSAIPDLTIGAEYIDTDEARFPNVAGSGNDAAMATASITLPIWAGRYRAERAEASARRSAAEQDRIQFQNRLLADLAQAHFAYEDAARKVSLYELGLLPKARQSLDVIVEAFTTGEAGFLDLVDAEQTLLEFELALERAQADQATERAQLERLLYEPGPPGTAAGGDKP